LSRREIVGLLSRRKKLSSKDFLEFYGLIWENTAFVKYQNPGHVEREHVKMARKQYHSFFCSTHR
jgi:hypothetical protein